MRNLNLFKGTLFLLLCLVCNVAWAQPTVGKYYKLKCKHDASFVYENADNSRLTAISNSDTSIDEDYKIWYLESSSTEGKYTLCNRKTGRYVTPGGEWKTSETKGDFYLVVRTHATENSPDYFNLSTEADASGSTCLHCWIGTPGKNWTGVGDGSQYEFVIAEIATPEEREYTINIEGGQTIKIGDKTYSDGDTYATNTPVSKADSVSALLGLRIPRYSLAGVINK